MPIRSLSEAYKVLEIHSSAIEPEVKSAYKRLALKTHPDKNINDPTASVKFHQVTEAFQLIMETNFNNTYNFDAGDNYEDDEDDDYMYTEEDFAFDLFNYIFSMKAGYTTFRSDGAFASCDCINCQKLKTPRQDFTQRKATADPVPPTTPAPPNPNPPYFDPHADWLSNEEEPRPPRKTLGRKKKRAKKAKARKTVVRGKGPIISTSTGSAQQKTSGSTEARHDDSHRDSDRDSDRSSTASSSTDEETDESAEEAGKAADQSAKNRKATTMQVNSARASEEDREKEAPHSDALPPISTSPPPPPVYHQREPQRASTLVTPEAVEKTSASLQQCAISFGPRKVHSAKTPQHHHHAVTPEKQSRLPPYRQSAPPSLVTPTSTSARGAGLSSPCATAPVTPSTAGTRTTTSSGARTPDTPRAYSLFIAPPAVTLPVAAATRKSAPYSPRVNPATSSTSDVATGGARTVTMPNLEGVPLCRVFLTRHGHCRFGSSCKFSHGIAPGLVPAHEPAPVSLPKEEASAPAMRREGPASPGGNAGGDEETPVEKQSPRSRLLGAMRRPSSGSSQPSPRRTPPAAPQKEAGDKAHRVQHGPSKSVLSEGQRAPRCLFVDSERGCRYGSSCKFSHDM